MRELCVFTFVPYELFYAADRPSPWNADAQWLACTAALDLSDLAKDSALTTNADACMTAIGGIGDGAGDVVERLTARWSSPWRVRIDSQASCPCRRLPPRGQQCPATFAARRPPKSGLACVRVWGAFELNTARRVSGGTVALALPVRKNLVEESVSEFYRLKTRGIRVVSVERKVEQQQVLADSADRRP